MNPRKEISNAMSAWNRARDSIREAWRIENGRLPGWEDYVPGLEEIEQRLERLGGELDKCR